MSGRGQDLPRLTSLRAFAALAVFLFHLARHIEWAPLRLTFAEGYVGVAFFYVLSGFVLTWSTRPSLPAREFYVRRFARVYPSHFVMLVVALLLPRLVMPVTPEALIANVLLVQAWFPQWEIAFGINSVSWSLSVEFFFYLCAPFLIRLGDRWPMRRLIVAFGGWFVLMSAVAVAMGLAGNATSVYAYTNPLIRSGEFVLGCLAAVAVRRGLVPRIPVTLGVGAVALTWLLTTGRWLPQSIADVVYVPAFLLLVLAAATTDLAGRPGLLTSRFLIYAGQVSFGFYLVHEPLCVNLR
nr:acyltransferase [Propionibacterium sp.]